MKREALRTLLQNELLQNFDCTPPMPVISRRIFDVIIRYVSGEKVRSELLGYGNDEFLLWQVSVVM